MPQPSEHAIVTTDSHAGQWCRRDPHGTAGNACVRHRHWSSPEQVRSIWCGATAGPRGRHRRPDQPHSLRHAFATIALDAEATLHALQDSMGHADPRTTRRYGRARHNLAKAAAYDVARALV
ncbi:tyrosine-type recombinase/integrase [Paenarthrobacter sp. NPDC092416]|uniref:tyrosine-type recombinase/integrase n=1 Tax=Paenarthrobacter sp. NPDC092416 TaxID=3364386 RepID=UPI003817C386